MIWDSTSLLYSDQYIEFGTETVVNPYITGLGERISGITLENDKTYMLFTSDQATPLNGEPMYGHHPFYLENRPKSASAHGVFMLNSNAMDVELKTSISPSTIKYKMIGGIVDLFIFLGHVRTRRRLSYFLLHTIYRKIVDKQVQKECL